MTGWDDEPLAPGCLVTPISRDNKSPIFTFDGWDPDGGAVPSGRQANWDHESTVSVGPGYDYSVQDYLDRQEEHGINTALLDVDGKNLLMLDIDLVDDEADADRESGKWADADAMWDFVEGIHEGTLYESASGGAHVPLMLDDEAYEAVFNNEYRAGWGVESLKGPAAKGYTLSPFSPGYEVRSSGGCPVLSLEDLEDLDALKHVERVAADDLEETDVDLSREEAFSLGSTDDFDEFRAAVNHVQPYDFDMDSSLTAERGDGTLLFDPAWRHSETGESLSWLPDKNMFFDLKHGKGFHADRLVALEENIMSDPFDTLDGAEWLEAVDLLRERGAPVPRYEDSSGEARLAPLREFEGAERLDKVKHDRVVRDLDAFMSDAIDGDHKVVSPMRSGKSGRFAAGATREHPRLIVTPNKGESRNSPREYADDFFETVPFTRSPWLELPSFADTLEELYARGFSPGRIRSWATSHYDVDEDEYDCPYFMQYKDDVQEALVMTSPGVETVEHFNTHPAGGRTIAYDDVHPLIEHTEFFSLSAEMGAFDELVRAVDMLEADSYTELVTSEDDLRVLSRLHESSADTGEDRETQGDAFDELDERTDEDPFAVDLCDLAASGRKVRADTLLKLKVVCEHETRVPIETPYGVHHWARHDKDRFAMFTDPLYPDECDIVVMNADHPPGLTELFFDLIGRDHETFEPSLEEKRAYWRVKNQKVLVARGIENTRSGGNVNGHASRELIDLANSAFGATHGKAAVLDSKKALEGYDYDDTQCFARSRGDPQFDDKNLGVVQGSSFWPDFVEDFTLMRGERVEIRQSGSDPAEVVKPDGERSDAGQEMLHWMKQAEPTQAAGRFGSGTDDESIVVLGTRHIGPQFDAYDVTGDVHLLTTKQRLTFDLVSTGRATTATEVAEARGVSPQAAGDVLRRLADAGLLERDEYAGDGGSHEYEGSDIGFSIRNLSDTWTRHEPELSPRSRPGGSASAGTVQPGLTFWGEATSVPSARSGRQPDGDEPDPGEQQTL
jgi:hypothetical protein